MSAFSRIAVCSPISATGKRITITKGLTASATDDTVYLSEALNIDTTQLNKCAYVAVALPNSNNTGEEVIICTKANYDSSAKTMSNCTRGLIGYGTGLTSDATQIGEHYAGTQITVPVLVQNIVQLQDAVEGDVTINPTIGTMAWDTSVTDSALTMPIYADATARDAAITTPVEGMKVKLTSEGVISSYVGGTWVSEGTDTTANGSTTVAGKYEAATAAERAAATATGGTGALLIPTNDALVKTSSGAGDENKIPILDSSGKLAIGFQNIDDTAYNESTWNANTDAPTKNAVRDVIEDIRYGKILLTAGEGLTGATTPQPVGLVNSATERTVFSQVLSGASPISFYTSTWLAASFPVGVGITKITKVTVRLAKTGSLSGVNLTAAIYTADTQTNGSEKPATLVASKSIDADTITTDNDYTITFDSPVTVDSSTDYCLVLSLDGGSGSAYLVWGVDTTNTNSTKSSSSDSGSTWSIGNTYSHRFIVYGNYTSGVLNNDATEAFWCDGMIGFTNDTVSLGADVSVQTRGVVSGFSGLTPGATYYLQNNGSIGTSAGTVSKPVGVAISATQLQIVITT